LIHFDIDDRYQDEAIVGRAISRREGVLLSIVVHLVGLVVVLYLPTLALFQPGAEELAEARARVPAPEPEEAPTFVFVRPPVDVPAPAPPDRGELSDIDRRARAPVVAPEPQNPLPFSRGNSAERVEDGAAARGVEDAPPRSDTNESGSLADAKPLPPADTGYQRPREQGRVAGGTPLGDALRNLQRYVENEAFNNPQGGGGEPGASIQFDTKGVEFGPWIRRFVAQVKRNWFVPSAAWLLRGRVVLQFNIHKDGRITDIAIVGPSEVGAFNTAAYNAILTSNPTEPLPPEYPSDMALFTVTFFYNEDPGRY